MENKKEILQLIPAIRILLSREKTKILTFIEEGSLFADKTSMPEEAHLFIQHENAERTLHAIKNKNQDLSYIFLQGKGIIIIGNTKQEVDQLKQKLFQKNTGYSQDTQTPNHTLNTDATGNISSHESYGETKGTNKPGGRAANKIVIVTGGAQGFGGGIARELFEEGANMIIADLNEEKGLTLAAELNQKQSDNQALFIKTDVSKHESVENMIYEAVKEFGGLDVMISNAGILRAGGLEEMDASTFELMTKVNYMAYFYCVKYASEVMKIQHQYNPDYFSDIIQINSKSGLKGSKKNFAYAGAKFGGIGLTQSYALELMPYKIKVNSICPGNFFEGPLWSDPENGLFVQYLHAGKVPGAKTIEDVKKHYESQVPAGRGCRVKDVVKAIYYVMEQEYETGQAIPVTGGQQMLK